MDIEKELEKEKRRLLFIKKHYKFFNVRNICICKIVNKLYGFKNYYPFVLSLIMSSMTLKGVTSYDYEKNVITKEGLEKSSTTEYCDDEMLFTEPYYVLDDKQFYKQTIYQDFNKEKINYYFTLSKEELDSLLEIKEICVTGDTKFSGLSYTTYQKRMYINEKKVLLSSLEFLLVTLFNFFMLGLGDALFIADFVKKIAEQYDELDENDFEMIDYYLQMIEENINALVVYDDAVKKRRVK